MLLDHKSEYDLEWAAMTAIAVKLGCTPETLRQWFRQAEKDLGIFSIPVAHIETEVEPNGAGHDSAGNRRRL